MYFLPRGEMGAKPVRLKGKIVIWVIWRFYIHPVRSLGAHLSAG
jgi:hypothetical protein